MIDLFTVFFTTLFSFNVLYLLVYCMLIATTTQKNDFKMLNGSLPLPVPKNCSSWIVQFIRRNVKRDSLPLVILLRSSDLHSSRRQNVVVLK